MDKYTARAIFDAAFEGRRFALVTGTGQSIAAMMREFDYLVKVVSTSVTVRYSAGHERIEFEGGGLIRFIPRRSAMLRGTSVDTVYVTCSINDPVELHLLRIMTATSADGELIRRFR